MDPQEYPGKKMSESESLSHLREELHRAKTSEKWLMDKNAEYKKKLSAFFRTDKALRAEQVEVAKLKKKGELREFHMDRLRKDLEKIKSEQKHEQTQRALEKTVSEQRVVCLEKKCVELQNKFDVEIMLREQKEKELETYSNVRVENKKLVLAGQALHHQVQELSGFKTFALKKMEELSHLLKKKGIEHDLTNQELSRIREKAKYYKDLVEDLIPAKERLEVMQIEATKLKIEIKKQEKQVDVYKRNKVQMTRDILILTRKIEENSEKSTKLGVQVDKLRQDKNSLILDLEMNKKEVEKQSNLILNLETELNHYNDIKIRLENKEREINRQSMARDQEIINLRNLICDSENTQRMQIIQTEVVKNERALFLQNLFKVQAEIGLKKKTIEELGNKIIEQNSDINVKDAELVKLKREYQSVKNQMANLRRQLAESKVTQDICVTAAGRDQMLTEKTLAKVSTKKENLEKEVVHYSDIITQLHQKFNVQETTRVTQEQMLKQYKEDVKMLKLQNKRLELQCYTTQMKMVWQGGRLSHMKSRRQRTRDKKSSLNPCLQMVYDQHREYQLCGGKLQLLEKKQKDIEVLECMLARRPNDAIEKLQLCQWRNRDLNKKLKASEGLRIMYENEHHFLKEKHRRMTDELRKLKLKCADISNFTRFPPISNKPALVGVPTFLTEDNANNQCESEQITTTTPLPQYRHLSDNQARLHLEHADRSRYNRFPPISNKSRQIKVHIPFPNTSTKPHDEKMIVTFPPIPNKIRRLRRHTRPKHPSPQ